MHSLLGDERFWCLVEDAAAEFDPSPKVMAAIDCRFLPNLWLGVSVETQKWAPVRLDKLASTSVGAVRFVSCEPLLGELDLSRWLGDGLAWVIAGGESGPRSRPMHPAWARGLRDQCRAAGVPFFFKQWGAYGPEADGHERGALSIVDRAGFTWPDQETRTPAESVRMRRVGKSRAGRLLDGQTWDEFPADAGAAR